MYCDWFIDGSSGSGWLGGCDWGSGSGFYIIYLIICLNNNKCIIEYMWYCKRCKMYYVCLLIYILDNFGSFLLFGRVDILYVV